VKPLAERGEFVFDRVSRRSHALGSEFLPRAPLDTLTPEQRRERAALEREHQEKLRAAGDAALAEVRQRRAAAAQKVTRSASSVVI
jgi:hypothetical protein